jgi:predicted DNA-binding transcriptional regulator YafY
MADSTIRKILMLTHLPREPNGYSTGEISRLLESIGHPVNLRTVQRDLIDLECHFPIRHERDAQGSRWAWISDATSLSLPAMSADEALALFMVERYVFELLPPQVTEHLEARFEQARETLNRSDALKNWTEKVLLLSRRPPMTVPRPLGGVLIDCYTSLQRGRCLRIHYAKDTRNEAKQFDFAPLGILIDDEVMYLVGTANEHEKVISLAVHRIRESKLLEKKAIKPKGFKLEEYARESLFDIAESKPTKIRLKIRGRLTRYLMENKLGADQTIMELRDGWSELSVTTKDSSPLRWLLLSWGDKVEVLEPQALRQEFGETLNRAAARYKSN